MKKPTLTPQFWKEGNCDDYADTTATFSHNWHLDVPKTKWWQKFLLFFVPMRVWETETCIVYDKILFGSVFIYNIQIKRMV